MDHLEGYYEQAQDIYGGVQGSDGLIAAYNAARVPPMDYRD